MTTPSIPDAAGTALILVDIQEKLLPAISSHEDIVRRQKILVGAAKNLPLHVIVTEQYPKGLGRTVPEISSLFDPAWPLIEKTSFSCFGEPAFRTLLKASPFKSLIVAGIETHVCIQQTVLDALDDGYRVFVPEDAVGSRKEPEKAAALRLLARRGAAVTSVESVLFMLMRDSRHPAFKAISALIK